MKKMEKNPNTQIAADKPAPVPTSVSSTSLIGVSELLSGTWDDFKKRWKTYILITLLSYALFIPVIVFLIGGLFIGMGSFKLFSGSSENLILLVGLGGIALLLLVFLVAFLGTWGQLAMLYAIKERNENIGVKASFRKALPQIVPYWWVSFVGSFLVVGAFLFFAVPGVIFMIWFSLAGYVFVSEGLGGMDALKKSREYVRGYWGSVLGRFIVLWLIFGAFTFLHGMLSQQFEQNQFLIFFLSIINLIFSFVAAPISSLYYFKIYEALREIKGTNLVLPSGRAYWLVSLAGYVLSFLFIVSLLVLAIPVFKSVIDQQAKIAQVEESMDRTTRKSSQNDAFTQAENIKRNSDVKAYSRAIKQYFAEQGKLPANITTKNQEIRKGGGDICSDLVPDYFNSLPVDPSLEINKSITNCSSVYRTGYEVVKNSDGTVTVSAPLSVGEKISVTN